MTTATTIATRRNVRLVVRLSRASGARPAAFVVLIGSRFSWASPHRADAGGGRRRDPPDRRRQGKRQQVRHGHVGERLAQATGDRRAGVARSTVGRHDHRDGRDEENDQSGTDAAPTKSPPSAPDGPHVPAQLHAHGDDGTNHEGGQASP